MASQQSQTGQREVRSADVIGMATSKIGLGVERARRRRIERGFRCAATGIRAASVMRVVSLAGVTWDT
jgi:hypothetical protein